jgi:ParB family chromosome partitioning protein
MDKPTDFKQIPVRLIDPSPFAIRQRRDAQLLGGSMRKFGLQSPVKVRPKAHGRYEIIFGDRRLEEAKKLGLKQINAIVEKADDRTALLEHVIENVARQDFLPLEEADAFQRLRKLGYNNERIAKLVGKHPSIVTNRLALLKLPPTVQGYIAGDKISATIAQRIAQIVPSKSQESAARTIVESRFDNYQAVAYLEALTEENRLQKLEQSHVTPESKLVHPALHAAAKKLVEIERRQVKEKLEEAISIEAMNIGNLEIWKLAQRIQPRIGHFGRHLFTSKEKIIEALRKDLEKLTQPKPNVTIAEVVTH